MCGPALPESIRLKDLSGGPLGLLLTSCLAFVVFDCKGLSTEAQIGRADSSFDGAFVAARRGPAILVDELDPTPFERRPDFLYRFSFEPVKADRHRISRAWPRIPKAKLQTISLYAIYRLSRY